MYTLLSRISISTTDDKLCHYQRVPTTTLIVRQFMYVKSYMKKKNSPKTYEEVIGENQNIVRVSTDDALSRAVSVCAWTCCCCTDNTSISIYIK